MGMQPKPPDEKSVGIEEFPDAWARFEKAVDAVMRAPPKHQTAPPRTLKSAPRRKGECIGGSPALDGSGSLMPMCFEGPKRYNGSVSLSVTLYGDYQAILNINIGDNPCWVITIKYYLLSGASCGLCGVH